VAFAATIPTQPGEAYVLPTAGKPQAPRRLTDLNPQLAGLPRGRQETVRWKASDGLEIEGVLLHPMGDARRESYPIVVIAHGGPEYENHDGWLTRSSEPGEALSERGDYVFYPNYRGSAGRGVAFAKADHHDLGGREFQDVLDGLDWLAGRERIDLKAAGMTGGSYGGYFSGLAATRYSDRFAAAVALFGISDWLSFLGQSDIPVENSAVHWDLWCYDHLEACRAASPVEHIGKARTPTLIFQGDADPRVPKPQSDELYAALKWKGVPVEYVVYPREKHGFLEREHQVETTRRLLAWFDAHLRP
jgi:dipeptidyl aminopeptidase/acylaminoacyl peptidase